MRIFTLLFAFGLFTSSWVEAQNQPVLPLDFESAGITYTFTDFDGGALTKISNPQSSGINTSATVAKMIKSAGQPWGGSFITLASPIDFSTNKTFKVKVFMPRVGAKLLLKVENLSNGAISYEKEATGTQANAWEELTFDYTAINTANQYQKVVLIFDLGTMGDGTANFTYLLDDVSLVAGGGNSLTQMNLPVTFDANTVDYGLVGFGGAEASSIVTDPTNANNKVAKVIKSATAELWAGTTITTANNTGFSSKIPFTATNKKMSVRVWSPHAGIKVRLKVEDFMDATKSVETEATSNMANDWETLTFDFAVQASGTAAINLAYNYNKASIFFNFGVTGAVAGERIYYFDDVNFVEAIVPSTPTTEPTVPSRAAANVISLFSNAYTNVPVNTWRTDWSAATLTETQVIGTAVKKYTNLNYVGIETTGANMINASSMLYFHVDAWTPNITAFRIKLVDFGADGAFGGTDDKEHELSFTPTIGSWNSYEIPLSNFVNLTTKGHIAQLIFSGDPSGTGTVYIANVYFHNVSAVVIPTEPTTASPLPTRPASNVISLFSNAYTNVPVNTWRTDWSAATLTDLQVAGNDVKKYSALDYVGIETTGANTINASNMTYFHFDYWTPNMTTLRIKLVDFGADGAFAGGDDKEHELSYTPILSQWNSLDIAISLFTGLTTRSHIAQIIISGLPTSSSTVYIDNVFFYNTNVFTAQTITFPVIADKTMGDAAFNLTATASSGLAVAYSTVSDKVTITGSSVTIVKAGRLTIKANQAGNGSFSAAPEVTQSFCIKPAAPTVTPSGLNTETVTLTSSSATGNQWYLNGNLIANATSNTFNPTTAGIYKVQVKADDCLSAFSSEVPLVITGDLNIKEPVCAYPSPADTYIEISGIKGDITATRMADVAGRSNALVLERSGEALRANVSHLPTGVYIIYIQEGNQLHKLKVLKK